MAITLDRGSTGALARAKQILRRNDLLSRGELEELDILFEDMNSSEVCQITRDPAYRTQLRRYHTFVRDRAVPIIAAMAFGFLVSAAMGVWLSLAH